MSFTIIPPTIEKESDEPFCEYCLNKRASEIAVMLGKQQEDKVYPQTASSELEILTQRNEILEKVAKQQEEKIKKMEANMEKMAGLLQQLISK